MYEIDFEGGDTFAVSEELYEALTAADLVEVCDDCSSEFSARLVAHPTSDAAATEARARIDAAIRSQRDTRARLRS